MDIIWQRVAINGHKFGQNTWKSSYFGVAEVEWLLPNSQHGQKRKTYKHISPLVEKYYPTITYNIHIWKIQNLTRNIPDMHWTKYTYLYIFERRIFKTTLKIGNVRTDSCILSRHHKRIFQYLLKAFIITLQIVIEIFKNTA